MDLSLLETLITDFTTVTLKEMDAVKLMDRKDTKFVFTENELPLILERLKEQYHLLSMDHCVGIPYETVYYDTDDYLFFRHHHVKKLNRFKVRFRKYLNSGVVFFEVKHKTGNGMTKKQRMLKHDGALIMSDSIAEYFRLQTGMDASCLKPSLTIHFSRMTLVRFSPPERVTLDFNLSYQKNDERSDLQGIVIAEAKQERHAVSEFVNTMRTLHIRRGSISKYCLGLSMMVPGLKNHLFLRKIKRIKKLVYDYSSSCEC